MLLTNTTCFNSKSLSNQHYGMLKSFLISKGLNEMEFDHFIYKCDLTGLNPMTGQIYPIKYGGQMTTITGIDGYRFIAERSEAYAPSKSVEFAYDQNNKLFSATAYVKKWTQDSSWHEVSHTVYWDEYAPVGRNAMWQKMPRVMLGKCAEAGVIRKAFPNSVAGIYTKEEMDQAKAQAKQDGKEVLEIEVEGELADQGMSSQKVVPIAGHECLSREEIEILEKGFQDQSARKKRLFDALANRYQAKVEGFEQVRRSSFNSILNGLKAKKDGD
jgi:phage recombination protein Bet